MADLKYTSGNWYAKEGIDQMVDEGTTVVQLKRNGKKLFVFSDADTHGDIEADAKLIAAAPGMHSALANAPIISMFTDAEKFIDAYEIWRDKFKMLALKKATD